MAGMRNQRKTHRITGIFICLSFFSVVLGHAQCKTRFQKEVFSSFQKSTVTYSDLLNLKMDVFEPEGDTLSRRPLVVLAFGGSFLSGSRNTDPTIVDLCQTLSKRGYVCASIDYRLGNIFKMADTTQAIGVVFDAVCDGKAALRYFIKDALTENRFRIDTSLIFAGGNSAGGVLFMHAAYLNHKSEAAPWIQQLIDANGGMEGNNGNPGYTYTLKGILNLSGALHSTAYISADDPSSINLQSEGDKTVPFYCARAMNGFSANLCGLGALMPVYDAKGIDYRSRVFAGSTHVPWMWDAKINDTLQTEVVSYLYDKVCLQNTINTLDQATSAHEMKIYPNPAQEEFLVQSDLKVDRIELLNASGQSVLSKNVAQHNTFVDVSACPNGFYFVLVQGNSFSRMLKMVIAR